ncbi:putative ubiquitin-conjugating enzyme E2 38 [Oryza brachyantha]|uniref:putative ubiquitin-conjugating enzyme E2 38 n=1 Tax=Oryza brachyantha TaxID=4533 RepID=UPI001ADB052F|nr:putative ubiquitin-conjugating enzyme E2 38 [Oryza brachyantha]
MDLRYVGVGQGSSSSSSSSSSSCRAADVAWDSSQKKRQRCEGSSDDQVGSSTSNSLQMPEPELQDFDNGENEEEDYYLDEDDCVYDDSDEFDNEFDGTYFNERLADKFDDLDLPPGVEATVPWLQKMITNEEQSSSKLTIEDENTNKHQFKQFDTVKNFCDHHYAAKSGEGTRRDWVKRIQHDWKLLEKDLPASIFVRVAEDRMDLLRAAIIGPKGTPYHDGLFFFDIQFTSAYPTNPPSVYYHSGGLRINPNLYSNGKVCLSLLGTWTGSGCEKWNPSQSTMLQVLVSIQALILNEKPYFNEPGYASHTNSESVVRSALDYNDNTFLHSCRTMLYSLRRPPEHFADLVTIHFRERGHTILAACRHYMEGHKVGSVVPEWVEEPEHGDAGASTSSSAAAAPQPQPAKLGNRRLTFINKLKTLFEELLMEFNVKGADTAMFLAEKLKSSGATPTVGARNNAAEMVDEWLD